MASSSSNSHQTTAGPSEEANWQLVPVPQASFGCLPSQTISAIAPPSQTTPPSNPNPNPNAQNPNTTNQPRSDQTTMPPPPPPFAPYNPPDQAAEVTFLIASGHEGDFGVQYTFPRNASLGAVYLRHAERCGYPPEQIKLFKNWILLPPCFSLEGASIADGDRLTAIHVNRDLNMDPRCVVFKVVAATNQMLPITVKLSKEDTVQNFHAAYAHMVQADPNKLGFIREFGLFPRVGLIRDAPIQNGDTLFAYTLSYAL